MYCYNNVKLTGYEVGTIIMSLKETLRKYEKQLKEQNSNKNFVADLKKEIEITRELIQRLDDL